MGSLNRKLNSSTCSSLLLWSAVLPWLLPSLRLRLMPIPLCSMELMELMEPMAMASPMPDMAMVPTPMPTTERGLLMLSPRLMLMLTTMELTVLAMLDTAMVLAMPDTLLPTPMEPMPTERGLLMLSPRLMLLFSTELTDMVDTVLAMPDTAMVPTPTPTSLPMPTERGLLMLSLRLMPMLTTMELMVLVMPDMAMLLPTPMEPTPMPTDMASKKSTTSNQSRPPSTNAEAQKQTKS